MVHKSQIFKNKQLTEDLLASTAVPTFSQNSYYWINEYTAHFKVGIFKEIPVSDFNGYKMIQYLREKFHIIKNQYLKNAAHRKLQEYKNVEWIDNMIPVGKKLKAFNYHKKMFNNPYKTKPQKK